MTTPTRLSVEETRARLGDGWTYVDVRTAEEFEAGHVPGAFNAPIAHAAPSGMAPNPDFARVMGAAFAKDARLVVGCKAGGRSLRALHELTAAGFTSVVDMRAGWDGARSAFGEVTEPGWSRCDLPVEKGQPEGRSWKDLLAKAP